MSVLFPTNTKLTLSCLAYYNNEQCYCNEQYWTYIVYNDHNNKNHNNNNEIFNKHSGLTLTLIWTEKNPIKMNLIWSSYDHDACHFLPVSLKLATNQGWVVKYPPSGGGTLPHFCWESMMSKTSKATYMQCCDFSQINFSRTCSPKWCFKTYFQYLLTTTSSQIDYKHTVNC